MQRSMLWPAVLLCGLLLGLFLWFRALTNRLEATLSDDGLSAAARFDLEEARSTAIAGRQTVTKFFGLLVLGGYLTYVAVVGTPMYGYVMEWLNLAYT
ncbi:MAG: hypothetical protein R2815_08820 [Flavobacteriales bacterium]